MKNLVLGLVSSLLLTACGSSSPNGSPDGGSSVDSGATSCGIAATFVSATVNGTPNCYEFSGAMEDTHSPYLLTTLVGSTPDHITKTLSMTFPGTAPGVGVFHCETGAAPIMMVYREVGPDGHTGSYATSCTIEITSVGAGTPVVLEGTFSGVLPYTDGQPPAGNWTLTDGRFTVNRQN